MDVSKRLSQTRCERIDLRNSQEICENEFWQFKAIIITRMGDNRLLFLNEYLRYIGESIGPWQCLGISWLFKWSLIAVPILNLTTFFNSDNLIIFVLWCFGMKLTSHYTNNTNGGLVCSIYVPIVHNLHSWNIKIKKTFFFICLIIVLTRWIT